MTLDNPGSNAADTGSTTAPRPQSASAKARDPDRPRKRYRKSDGAMISPAEAFRDYLALGYERTVVALHEQYESGPHKSGKRPPSNDTLKRWASRFKWTEQAARHDQQLAETQTKAIVERLAQDAADVAETFAGAAQVMLATALERRYELTADQAMQWAHKLGESAHAMRGGVTSRTEQRTIVADATDHLERWLTAAQEAEQAAQQTAGPAADKPKVIDVDAQDIEPADAKPTNDQ